MAGTFRVIGTNLLSQASVHSIKSLGSDYLRGGLITSSNILNQQLRFRKRNKPQSKAKPKVKEVKEKKKWSPKIKVQVVEVEDPDVKYAGRIPEDDVWIRQYYPIPRYSLLNIIKMHREAAVPEIYDSENGILFLNCTLDLRTKKKTKFLAPFKNTVVLPHFFKDGLDHRILVFAKSEDDKEIAKQMGAAFFGSVDLIKSIQAGTITPDDYDHVISTVDMMQEITTIRKALRDHFPNKVKGNIGGDVAGMMKYFMEGKTYESYNIDTAVGKVEVPIGTLDMYDSQLTENYIAMIESICSHRSANLGPLITKCSVECPPSDEVFLLEQEELIPPSQKNIIAEKIVQDEEPVQDIESDDEDSAVAIKR